MKSGALLTIFTNIRNRRFSMASSKQIGFLSILLLFMIILTGGCASIIGEKAQLIGINSNPDSAQITIKDEYNQVIFKGTTPTSVTLKKGDGYFHGKDYAVELDKEGYSKQVVVIKSTPSGWYIGGNLIFGGLGLIGWFIVDPATGAMWTLSPDKINTDFDALKGKGTGSSRIYTTSFQAVWTALPTAVGFAGLNVADENKEAGYLLAKRGSTAFSAGEKIVIFVEKLADDKSAKVEVVSKQASATNTLAPNWEETIFNKLTSVLENQMEQRP